MPARVVTRDRGARALLACLEPKEAFKTVCGVFGPNARTVHPGSERTNEQLAAIHEFGMGVPRRPFISAWADQLASEPFLRQIATDVVAKRITLRVAMEARKERLLESLRAFVAAGVAPPNAESTLEQKSGTTPLVDTGFLLAALAVAVMRKADQDAEAGASAVAEASAISGATDGGAGGEPVPEPRRKRRP